MKKAFNVVDMFCGAGGESSGIMQAALEQDMKVNLYAINHWEVAMETHAANYPYANHLCESIESIDPTRIIKNGKVDLLWASPECTHFSNARGGRPRSDQSRASPWLILKWLQELQVERVIIENVKEFLSWGPLDRNGKPIKNKKGDIFKAFIFTLQSLGYKVDWRVLCAADFGAPTTRQRLFIQAVKGRKKILWPQPTHSENGNGLKQWRSAREIIDWNIHGRSIFNRKKPLAENTIKRIAAGIEKYWGDDAKAFLACLYGTGTARTLDLPLPAVSCVPHYAVVEPVSFMLGQQSCAAPRSVDSPAPTVATAGAISLCRAFITRYHGGKDFEKRNHSLENPLPCLDTSNRYGLVEPFVFNIGQTSAKDRARSIDEPLSTVVTKAEHCLVEPGYYLDILFRMLQNPELKLAQGFQSAYILKGNTTEQTIQIGNAVPPPLAKAQVELAMSA